MKSKFSIYSFYRFTEIKDKKFAKKRLDEHLSLYIVRGTILLADEGINGTISGSKKDLDCILKFINNLLKIRNLNLKINKSTFLPFNRMKVRLKKEIVSLGKGIIDTNHSHDNYVNPSEWNNILENKNIKVIDVRNNFEIDIGQFQNSINPETASFREFPKSLSKMNINKNDAIALYCTGGIRCEKASAYMKNKGFRNVVQLQGGILNYLSFVNQNNKKTLWKGDCFVFDNRVTVNKNLNEGEYKQCYGCRHPLNKKDINSKYYKKGVHCPKCINKRTSSQIKKSEIRQKQIDIAKKNDLSNPFRKIVV